MHPAIRLATFILFAALVGAGRPLLTGTLMAGVIVLHGSCGWRYTPPLGRALWRLKWLFLSLLVVYAWWLPGQPLLPYWPQWSPSIEGLREGALRAGALAAMVAGVVVLLETTDRTALIDALRWYLRPLRRLGFPDERAALRLTLILGLISDMQKTVAKATPAAGGRRSLRAWVDTADRLFSTVVRQAEAAEPVEVALTAPQAPPARHWLYPLGLLLAALALW